MCKKKLFNVTFHVIFLVLIETTLISLKQSSGLLKSVDKNYFFCTFSVKKYRFEKIVFKDPERAHLPRVCLVRHRL